METNARALVFDVHVRKRATFFKLFEKKREKIAWENVGKMGTRAGG